MHGLEGSLGCNKEANYILLHLFYNYYNSFSNRF